MQSFPSSDRSYVDPITGQTPAKPPAHSPNPSHSSISSSDSFSSLFKSALKVEDTKLGADFPDQGLAVNSLLSHFHQPSPIRPASPLFSQQRSPKKQKRRHSKKLDSCSPVNGPTHGSFQDSRSEVAANLNSQQSDHVAVWDDCEQSLEDARKEVAEGRRPLLRRRLGFLR